MINQGPRLVLVVVLVVFGGAINPEEKKGDSSSSTIVRGTGGHESDNQRIVVPSVNESQMEVNKVNGGGAVEKEKRKSKWD